MSFFLSLFLIFLSLKLVLCEKCSDALHLTFKKGFNLNEKCNSCKVLPQRIFFLGKNWTGFCVRNEFFLFEDWKFKEQNELKGSEPFVLVTEGFCESFESSQDLDMDCLKQFNFEKFSKTSELKSSLSNVKEEKKLNAQSLSNLTNVHKNVGAKKSLKAFFTSGITTSNNFLVRTNSRRTTPKMATEKFFTLVTSTPGTSSKNPTFTSAFTETTAKITFEKSSASTTPIESASIITAFTERTTAKTTFTERTSKITFTERTPAKITFTKTTPSAATSTGASEKSSTARTTSTGTVTETLLSQSPEKTTSSYEITKNTTPKDSIPSTTFSSPFLRKTCESNEFFYNDYCYFIKLYENPNNDAEHPLIVGSKRSSENEALIDSLKSCQDQHPKALGLAVETEEENRLILSFLKTVHLYNCNIIFTSGVKENDSPGEWVGWNLKVNETIVNPREDFMSKHSPLFYCINSCQSFWYFFSPNVSHVANTTFFLICKRPQNPKKIQLELHELCLRMYRESSCYVLNKQKNFCCAKDEHGEIWFACPNATKVKRYPDGIECDWSCRNDGFFAHDRPICKGRIGCSAIYNNVKYTAAIQRYALRSCPKPFSGYSSWYCSSNGTFLGTPDYSLCCERNISKCKDMDAFLNVWMGCPSKKILKRTACPPGTFLKEAVAEWFCQANGTFLGSEPDYSKCNKTSLMCAQKDRFGTEWIAMPQTIATKNCPPSFTGNCFWKCKNSGKFEGPEPDCSKCKADWMEKIAEKIKNYSQHEEVMEIMENYTKKEDIRIGFGHVINLTSDCVTLYKKQVTESNFGVFDKFLKSYSKILTNVAADFKIWSSFSEPNREEYVEQILKTTQSAAFANLEIKNGSKEQYNATFTTSSVDGFDFFVAYNPPRETDFPLQNFSQSNWNLKIKEINESFVNFATMGLIMNCSLSSLMFPRGNKTKDLEMNAPAVTFAVAAAMNGKVDTDPNVVVVISFKHSNKTKFPATEIIRRKLHAGEYPSGVFNSTLCFYYRDSDWSTDGCSVTYTSRDQTTCTCNHLSTIGLLMKIHKYEPNRVLELVSSVSSGITIISLVLTLFVFYFFDKGNNDRLLIGKNLCLCLLLGHIMLFGVMDKKFFNTTDTMCKVYAILLHYVFLAAFGWMFVEGCHLYRMLVIVFDSDIDYRWIYLLIGYGGPLGIVGATQLVGFISQEQPYGQDELCWLKTPKYVWAFIGPVIVLTSINFCILITAVKMAVTSKRQTEKSNFGTIKLWLKGWISLSALLGITWLFGLGYICYNENLAYTFVVLNGLQGFFIFLFRCILCEQYKSIILKKIKSWFLRSQPMAIRKNENVKSKTKVYAISATKSSSNETIKDSGYETTTVGVLDNCDRKKYFDKFLHRTKPKERKSKESPVGIHNDISITLTPAMSEAYLRNRMIAKNFSARKSKATWLSDSKNFSELFHQNISKEN